MLTTSLFILFAYLAGSVSSAIIVCRLMGFPDPRSGGSGNPGATNILRLHGKKAALITLLGDSMKGLLPLLLGQILGLPLFSVAIMGLAAFIGHLYPVFFEFKGGKGVATYIGVLFGLAWPLGMVFAIVWLLFAKVFRISSLAALIAAITSPIVIYYYLADLQIVMIYSIMVVMLFWRHRTNIRDLFEGVEGRLDEE